MSKKYNSYKIGVVILHPIFGIGRIIDITGEGIRRIAPVTFEGVGAKKIAVSWIDANCKRQ